MCKLSEVLSSREPSGRSRVPWPSASERLRVHVQQLSGDALRTSQLALYSRLGGEPDPSTMRCEPAASPHGAVGCSASLSARGGALTLSFVQPASGWLYLLLLAAAAPTERVAFDVRVSAQGGAAAVIAAAGTAERAGQLTPAWRYLVDPEGATTHSAHVVARHLKPV